jgi:hypothetical protein
MCMSGIILNRLFKLYCLIAYNLSSFQCKERRQNLSVDLESVLVYDEDSDVYVRQSVLMDLLDLAAEGKNVLTRTITALFPGSSKKRKMIDHESMYPFQNSCICKLLLFYVQSNKNDS